MKWEASGVFLDGCDTTHSVLTIFDLSMVLIPMTVVFLINNYLTSQCPHLTKHVDSV